MRGLVYVYYSFPPMRNNMRCHVLYQISHVPTRTKNGSLIAKFTVFTLYSPCHLSYVLRNTAVAPVPVPIDRSQPSITVLNCWYCMPTICAPLSHSPLNSAVARRHRTPAITLYFHPNLPFARRFSLLRPPRTFLFCSRRFSFIMPCYDLFYSIDFASRFLTLAPYLLLY